MKLAIFSLSAVALSLAACGSSISLLLPDQAAVETIKDDNAMDVSSGPFGEAETKMDQQMMAAMGSDAGQSWAKKMIAHHQGAIDM